MENEVVIHLPIKFGDRERHLIVLACLKGIDNFGFSAFLGIVGLLHIVPVHWFVLLIVFLIIRSEVLLTIDDHFEEVGEDLDSFFDFAFHELVDSLGEVFIKIESFGAVVVLLSSHDELVSFDEVLLPHEDPSYFVKSIAVVKFMEVGVNVLSHTFIQILQSLLVIYLLTPLLSLPQNQYALGEVKFSFNCFLLHLHVFLVELRKVYVHTLVQRDGFLEIA